MPYSLTTLMNTPSPIASPIPSNRNPAVPPFCAALAVQIGALTHLVDEMERFCRVEHGTSAAAFVEGNVADLHSTIDALNALYEAGLNAQLDTDSLQRRLYLSQQAAEKHHKGNRAACEREGKLRAALIDLYNCAELSQDDIEPETRTAIDAARCALIGN